MQSFSAIPIPRPSIMFSKLHNCQSWFQHLRHHFRHWVTYLHLPDCLPKLVTLFKVSLNVSNLKVNKVKISTEFCIRVDLIVKPVYSWRQHGCIIHVTKSEFITRVDIYIFLLTWMYYSCYEIRIYYKSRHLHFSFNLFKVALEVEFFIQALESNVGRFSLFDKFRISNNVFVYSKIKRA